MARLLELFQNFYKSVQFGCLNKNFSMPDRNKILKNQLLNCTVYGP